MTKNNNLITFLFYAVIIFSFIILIYISCKPKIREGLSDKVIDNAPQGQEYNNYSTSVFQAQNPGVTHSSSGFVWNSLDKGQIGGTNLNGTLNQIHNIMDLSGNIHNTLTFLYNQKDLLRLMGINELGNSWSHLNPTFMQFYKDKMYFLNDLILYVNRIESGNSGDKEGDENWWNNIFGSNSHEKNNWWKNVSGDVSKDFKGAENWWDDDKKKHKGKDKGKDKDK